MHVSLALSLSPYETGTPRSIGKSGLGVRDGIMKRALQLPWLSFFSPDRVPRVPGATQAWRGPKERR